MPLEQKQGKNASCPHETCEGDDIKQISQQKHTWLQIPRKDKKENCRRVLRKTFMWGQPHLDEVPGEASRRRRFSWELQDEWLRPNGQDRVPSNENRMWEGPKVGTRQVHPNTERKSVAKETSKQCWGVGMQRKAGVQPHREAAARAREKHVILCAVEDHGRE